VVSPLPSITTSSHPRTTNDLLSHLSRLGGAVSWEGWTSRGSTDSSGATWSCRAMAGGTRCCSCNSSTTSSGSGWRRQRRHYRRCSTAWRSRGRCGMANRRATGMPLPCSARSSPRRRALDPWPLVLRLPQGFPPPSPPPCPAYRRMRMSDAKPQISFAGRFTDRDIAASFNEVAPSSPLPPGRIPFSPIAYVIRFGLPSVAVGGLDPSSPPSQ
jgi:hypothetical protein